MVIKFNKKIILTLFIIFTAMLSSLTGFIIKSRGISAVSASVTQWGLSFQKENSAPIGNLNEEKLNKYNAFFIGDRSDNNIFLTFDAGYEAGYTEQILNILKEENVKGTFFIVGNYIEKAPDLVKRMVQEGHTVANHSYSHPDITKLDAEDLLLELKKLENAYKKLTGKEMVKYFRPPEGKFTIENLECLSENGYKTILWSLAYADWDRNAQPSPEKAIEKLTSRIHKGAVILLHSTSETNSIILKDLIKAYKNMGFSFAALNELKN